MARPRVVRRFRRRRRTSETYTTIQCFGCINVWQDTSCGFPLIDVFPLLNMSLPRSSIDTTEVTSGSDKAIVLDGIRFQAEYTHDPSESLSCPSCDPPSTSVAFNLRVWEAVVVLPLNPGSANVPAYLPTLTSSVEQSRDIADRVLWKRISIMPIWGLGVTTIPQLETTIRDVGHGPVAVKSKVRLDDRHGLFFVRNFVHDVVTGNPNGSSTCSPIDCDENRCSVPIQHDMWFKIFYHVRK